MSTETTTLPSQTIAPTSSSFLVPTLPPEIFACVVDQFGSDRDLVFLWTVLRDVSHLFRRLVDEMVRRKHLPKMFILPCVRPENDPRGTYLASPFLHLSSTSPLQALFSFAPELPLTRRRSFAKEFCPTSLYANAFPPARVSLRRLANDTALQGWQVDADQLTITIDWRKAISALLWEERLRTNLSSRWFETLKVAKAKLWESLDDMTEERRKKHMRTVIAARSARDESAMMARHKRLVRERRRTDPAAEDWAPSRKEIEDYENVEQMAIGVNSWNFSDDE